LAAAGAAVASCVAPRAGAVTRPNILFLLADDMRWDSLGCMGNPVVQTPALDALAARGTRFTNAFATTAICMASRASILTGLYTTTHGVEEFTTPLPPARWAHTYPALLRQAGYHTGFVGKVGLGGELPTNQFDAFDGFDGQGQYLVDTPAGQRHLTPMMADSACRMIAGAPDDRPFCISVSFKAPHQQDGDPRQYVYDPELKDLYADVAIPVPETTDQAFFDALPEFLRTSEGRVRWGNRFSSPGQYQEMVKAYYRLITGIDQAVAQMLKTLEERGQLDNTVIVFTSDHGSFLGERGMADKWLMHEPSIRIPLLIVDPSSAGGAQIPAMALTNDLAPTLLELAGITPPPFMQGRSLVPWLRGKTPAWRAEFFYEHHFGNAGKPVFIPASEGVRTETWKYIRYVEREPLYEELYNLADDPHEKNNLALLPEPIPELEHFRQRWQTWRSAILPMAEPVPWSDPA
jgi:arylsulfatase A-like enzyme